MYGDFFLPPNSRMSMYEAIKKFNTQFKFEPKIENSNRLKGHSKFIVLGMGGSHLAADLLRMWNPHLDVTIHQDYGLPILPESVLKNSLIIASSYSGNTEEVLDGYKAALAKNYSVAAVSIGGKLMELAREDNVAYVQMPDTGIQPRMALGFSLKSLLALMRDEVALHELENLARDLLPETLEASGQALAQRLRGKIPVFYSSRRNSPLAYCWKIKFNETGKIPAFYNMLPELNHNEMNGFDAQETTRDLSEKFSFIFLKDETDHPKIVRRMDILKKLYENRGLPVAMLELKGRGQLEKIFSSLVLADWASYYTAQGYRVEAEQVPMVEELKKLIKDTED